MSLDSPLAAEYPAHIAEVSKRATVALERGGFDHLVIPSGVLRYQVFDDRDYAFAVNPNFKYWVPITNAPNSWIVFTPGSKPKLIFMQPHDYWHSVPQDPSGYWVDQFDIVIIREADEALKHLPSSGKLAILGEENSALGSFVPNNPAPVLDYLDYHRHSKTPYEITMMRQATRIGVLGHLAAEKAFREGKSEFAIHLAYQEATQQEPFDLPYMNIIGLNENGAVLHYTNRARTAPPKLLSFLIDAGASFGGYASDITRTYSYVQDEFQAMVDAVDKAELELCAMVVPGVDYKEIHMATHMKMSQILNDFGVITCSPEAALAGRISNAFFPHGIGHPIGLQVHDVAGFHAADTGGRIERPDGQPYLRLTRELMENSVVTIEPGIYFIQMLLDEVRATDATKDVNWDRVAEFMPYGGIRIEDNVVARSSSAPLNLTREEFAKARS